MSLLSNPSQLITRNFAQLEPESTLLVEPLADNLATEWQDTFGNSCDLFTTDYVVYRHQQGTKAKGNISFSHRLECADNSYRQVIFFWPKSKALAQYLLTQLTCVLAPGTSIWLVGDNRGGIKSGVKKLPQGLSSAVKQDAARHCSLFHCVLETQQAAQPESSDEHWFELTLGDLCLKVCSYPGVFNHGELDPGTRLLLAQDLSQAGRALLDVGCGAGIIASYYGLTLPDLDLTLCDVNAMALAASRKTLAANGLTGKVIASDVYTDIQGSFDLIVSNPPFHQGLDTNYDITQRLVEGAPSRLGRQGALRIVANSFLKYPEVLARHFESNDVMADDRKFRVYHATGPK